VQLLDDHAPQFSGMPSIRRNASLYDVVAARNAAPRPAGEWNDLEVLC